MLSVFTDLVMGVVRPIIKNQFPDPVKQAEIEAQIKQGVLSLDLAQAGINLEQAKHKSIFVAGARPFLLWVCGVAMAYHFLVFPLCSPFVSALTGVELAMLEWQELSVVLTGMLGMSSMRSYEKVKGVARSRM